MSNVEESWATWPLPSPTVARIVACVVGVSAGSSAVSAERKRVGLDGNKCRQVKEIADAVNRSLWVIAHYVDTGIAEARPADVLMAKAYKNGLE